MWAIYNISLSFRSFAEDAIHAILQIQFLQSVLCFLFSSSLTQSLLLPSKFPSPNFDKTEIPSIVLFIHTQIKLMNQFACTCTCYPILLVIFTVIQLVKNVTIYFVVLNSTFTNKRRLTNNGLKCFFLLFQNQLFSAFGDRSSIAPVAEMNL